VTFNDTVTFHINNDEVHAYHIPPAHTDGDSIVRFRKANVVHTGDVFAAYRYPFIDVENGGSVKGIVEAMDKLLPMLDDNTKVIPGHGPLMTMKDVRRLSQHDRHRRKTSRGPSQIRKTL
jgi:glyoxylase-like metal-dependent hydrolase (beta-lactamase superfamily II)